MTTVFNWKYRQNMFPGEYRKLEYRNLMYGIYYMYCIAISCKLNFTETIKN